MLRNTTLLFGLLLLLALFVAERKRQGRSQKPAAIPTAATASASPSPIVDAGPPAKAELEPEVELSELQRILSGSQEVPPLPKGAPQRVRFGVVLLTHDEAEFPPKNARTKAAAKALALELLPLAKTDFAEAVKKGDSGSVANAGSMPRNVLQPAHEYVLFTLEKGQVLDEPIDSARGYWLVRRIK